MYKMTVLVTLQIEGAHNWPDAPDEVSFLRDRHRHVFHVHAWRYVRGHDREVEIITLKREIADYFDHLGQGDMVEFGHKSCEHIAVELMDIFALAGCRVTEDGENGAEVWYE